MRITVDSNVLLRAVLGDDLGQQELAIDLLDRADFVAISTPALCEFAWVLDRTYKKPRAEIANALGQFLNMGNVTVDRPAIEAGITMLRAGRDFADGVIAHEGRWLGGETFVSFDRKAVKALSQQGVPAKLLS